MSWLSVVGIGEDGLSPAARALVEAAEVVVGGQRHLDLVDTSARKIPWPSPFSDSRALLEKLKPARVAVLASGDPMWFGAGATLARWFPAEDITVLPHPGAFSLAAARLKWPLQDCLCLTIHGRPVESLALHLQPGRQLLVLAEDGDSPKAVAALLALHGFAASRITVLEHLGGAAERVHGDIRTRSADLCVIAIEVAGGRGWSPVPGLPDDAFRHDGQLTKREVRAVTLAALAPRPGEVLWDIGAGCGSVAIEWMRAGGMAIALEPVGERLALIAANAALLGVPGLDIRRGRAPADLPEGCPDAVFVGGGVSVPGLLETCWHRLAPGGRLGANAVTAEGEAALLAFRVVHGGEMARLSVARLAPVGGFHSWHPAMPVTQYVGWKG